MLHGEIKINRQEIASWEAVRTRPWLNHDGWNYYAVAYKDDRHNFEGRIKHRYADGAAVLATKVLAWASREMAKLVEKHESKAS